ncbi:hypothetical protein GTZ99_04255 [Novosphingobium sp. FSY-8]|uniref:DoxX-like protein n=1 Tax=Novosphingobium ovatum TaxID=1908523 RepID=A0ABW9XB47_9SPHN|nr:hypothetical protein [Novosphingobium ovatum]NBC35766.1 hypothetical protein [Novosphingobium ovatum]
MTALFLLWNLYAAAEFLAHCRDAQLNATDTPQGAFLTACPTWALLGWGLGALMGVGGSMLMALRRRVAALAFALGFVGYLVHGLWRFDATPAHALQTSALSVALVLAMALAQMGLARRLFWAGLLR